MATALTEIVVVPRNGYANRLQAWASSAILAREMGVALSVVWEPESIAPAPFFDLFAPKRDQIDSFSLMTTEVLEQRIGEPHSTLPRYLTVDADRRLVTLAGHDRGEQAFMEELELALAHPCQPTVLVIVAGGKFTRQGTLDFAAQRRAFYRALPWHPTIMQRVTDEIDERPPFLGLHVRGTDRSLTAPTPSRIQAGVGDLVASTGIRSVFLAADSTASRHQWQTILRSMGLEPWTMLGVDLDRSTRAAGVDAIVDWCLLGRSAGIVYSQASSFGEEAAVCCGGLSLALTAGTARQRARALRSLAASTITYPRRRLSRYRARGG